MTEAAFTIVPFDREDPAQLEFVEKTFVHCVSEDWPWEVMSFRDLKGDLKRQMKRPDVRTALAVMRDEPSNFLGWASASALEREIVFAWTTAAYRSKGPLRIGVCGHLMRHLGIDVRPDPDGSRPRNRLRYWTRTAAILRGRGYNLQPMNAE